MTNTLVKHNGSAVPSPQDRSLPWTQLRDLFGFDPFQNIRASYGFDYDVSRTDNGYEVEVPVPGYGTSQISVTFKDGIINVAGKTERRSFSRSFTIPDEVDAEAISAKVQDGMLVLKLPRQPEAQPKTITVQ